MAHCDVMDKVRKWNVKFDQGQDPLAFIERIEELAECYEIPVDKLVKSLPELLTKNALVWYRNNKQNWRTWLEFIKDFKNFFLPPRFHIKLENDIRSRLQKPGERARDYVLAMQSMQRWQNQGTKEDKLDRIYQNLLPEYRLYIKTNDFRKLTELLSLAEEFEQIKMDEKQMKPRVENRQQKQPLYPLQIYKREECCWRCGQRGHIRRTCRNKSKLFCSRCGKEDIFSKDCKCKNNSGNEKRMMKLGGGTSSMGQSLQK